MNRSEQTRRVWIWPILVSILSSAGLWSALMGERLWDLAAYALLTPVVLWGVKLIVRAL